MGTGLGGTAFISDGPKWERACTEAGLSGNGPKRERGQVGMRLRIVVDRNRPTVTRVPEVPFSAISAANSR